MFLHFLRYRFLHVAAAALAVGSWASRASAELAVYEGFDYADGTNLRGTTGGDGWTNAWANTGASTETATEPGLTYPDLPVFGNKAEIAGEQTSGNGSTTFLRRQTAEFGTDGTALWLSFLGQRTGDKSGDPLTYERFFGLSLETGPSTEKMQIGETSTLTDDAWSLIAPAGSGNAQTVISSTPIDQLSFLLVRIDFGESNLDNAHLWVNPDLSLGESGLGAADASVFDANFTFNQIRLGAGGSQSGGAVLAASGLLDEIRIGDSFASVIGPGLIPGDVNGDLVVDINDYIIIRDSLHLTGATRSQGDLNGDDAVNLLDFRIWKDNRTDLGAGAGAQAALGSVPEPSSLALVLLGMIAFASRRFCRR